MKTTLISKENNEAKMTMDFTAEEFDEAVNKAYKKNRNRYPVDGFRKGRAPRKIIEHHYGEGLFFEDAINDLFQDGYPKALEEVEIEVIDNPKVDFGEIGDGKPLQMTITVPVFPIVEVRDYDGVEVDQIRAEVTDEEVDREIETLQKRNARIVTVDREAKDGDSVILDYAGFVGDDQFDGGTAENYELKIGSHTFIPGFEDQLIGAKAGEEVDVNVTFPEKYQAENLAGKDAVFHCKIHEVKEEQLPDIDDEFVKDVSEFDTLDELKDDKRKSLLADREEINTNEAKNALVEKIVEKNEFYIPEVMINDEVDSMLNEFNQQLAYQGMNLDMYLKYTGGDIESFRETLKDEGRRRVTQRILLRSIASQENIAATPEELDEELQNLADRYKMDLDTLKDTIGKNYIHMIEQDLVVKKTVDELYDRAKVTMVDRPEEPEEPEEAADDAEAPAEDAPEGAPAEEPAETAEKAEAADEKAAEETAE